MRVTLDLDSGIVSRPFEARPLDRLTIALGDAPLEVRLLRSGVFAQLTPGGQPAKLQFTSKKFSDSGPDYAGAAIVFGTVDLSASEETDPARYPIVACGEDWSAAALTNLFTPAYLDSVDLRGQFRWKNGNDAKFSQSRFFDLSVLNTFFTVDLPGAPVQTAGSQKGTVLIPVDALSVNIAFAPAFAAAPYVDVQVLKPDGGDNIFGVPRRATLTANGLTVDLSGPPSIAGHYLSWLAYL